ncbi:MAG: hypothetical protein ABW098_06200 [Candidatus Thiodiazotropha sp.]
MQSLSDVHTAGAVAIKLIATLVVVCAFLFVLYASYPGYMNPDSMNQLTQIITGEFNDWHAPFSTLVWSMINELIPGPFGFVILVNILIWGSILVLSFAFYRHIGVLSIAILSVPLLPGAFNMLGNVHKDVLLVGWLLVATVCAYLAYREGVGQSKKMVFLILSNLLVVAAFLTRMNSIFAIIPLLFYINHGFGWRRNILVIAVLFVLMPMLHGSLLAMTQAERMHAGDSIKTYQLLGLSYMQGKNLFPGEWSDEQTRKIVESCYTPVQWDTASLWGKCGFIQTGLERQKLWGSDSLTKAWLSGVVDNPLALFTLMSASFHKSINDPNSRSMFFKAGPSELFHWEVETDPPRLATALVQRYVTSPLNDRLGRPLLFAVIAIIALAVLFFKRSDLNSDSVFAMALLCSGLLNILSYFIVTVSAEYRYFYWSGYAIYLGFLITLYSILIDSPNRRLQSPGGWTQKALIGLLGISVGLVAGSTPLPPIERHLSLTPMDEKEITLKGLHPASKPRWMGISMDGEFTPHGWQADGEGRLNGNRRNGVLNVSVPTHGLALELVLVTGKDKGRVLIESEGFREVVDLSTSADKDRVVTLRPTPTQRINSNRSLWSAPLKALFYGLAAILFLVWMDSRYRSKIAR